MAQVLGALLIFTLVPLIGALPLTGWIVRLLSGKRLTQIGTGNTSVSAAFYHGGTLSGVFSVVAEALKGIGAVLLARYFFGSDPIWPVLSLIALVMGRYWGSQGAGTTNVAWGFFVYDPLVAGLTFIISLIGFTLLRMRQQGKLFVLVLMPVLTALAHPTDGMRVLIVACLSGLVGWIYQKIPDDLDLPATAGESRQMFRFFQGDRAFPSLSTVLDPAKVGAKAATLSQLQAWGYPVPPGYVLPAGDDPAALIATVFPGIANPADSQTHDQRVVARSSAAGEDGLLSSAAGQYASVTDITSPAALERAITVCLNAYNAPSALRYRQSRGIPEGSMNVLVQPHISGVFSGVAFSRDPIAQAGEAVIVEALPGAASQVVSGKITPERYQVRVADCPSESWQMPPDVDLPIAGNGQTPPDLIQQIAYLTRHIEQRFHGIPQDIEWTFDGEQIWVLQSRPITTLTPIWTRKIAAEVIPGVIRPLTWSINRPLTCGVWGDLFTIVLKDRAAGIDFTQTATLHYARAYFNATLLGDLFTRMGLPPESLEFLTRGAKFSRPPLSVTLRNAPGLLRLLRQEMTLPRQFAKADKTRFRPALAEWDAQSLSDLSEPAIAHRSQTILDLLKQVTYYNILAPLSLALRQALLKVDLARLDNHHTPEVAALEALKALALELRSNAASSPLAPLPPHLIEPFLAEYGYLSDIATDIAIPTWRESPQPIYDLLDQYLQDPDLQAAPAPTAVATGWQARQVQARLDLKGKVAEVYNRLLAALRACFVELESRWLADQRLAEPGDIFFLTWAQVLAEIDVPTPDVSVQAKAAKALWQQQGEYRVPALVYGQSPPLPVSKTGAELSAPASGTLRGIGASGGNIEGTLLVLTGLPETSVEIDAQTILVVPYTDAGWSPLLARIGGLIAEVGGQLSHGAIIAREYGIPAVMDVTDATHRLTTGQRARLDGSLGTIEIL